MLDVIFNDEWIISQNSMAATKVFHFSSTVYLCSRRLSLEWEKMNCSSMLKSKEKWREILCPKELRNHLGDFIKKRGKNIEKQIRLYFFRSRIILHIYQCTDSGEVQVFFYVKTKQKIWGQMNLLIVMQREKINALVFLSLKQNHEEIW